MFPPGKILFALLLNKITSVTELEADNKPESVNKITTKKGSLYY